MEEKKVVIKTNGTVIHLLTLFLVLSKLDGTMEITWMMAFLPFFISYLIPIVCEVICFIFKGIANMINSFKETQKYNTSKPGNGNRLYWDEKNKRMYVPFEVEGNDNHE
jgi:hypothetical protein